MVNYWQRKLSMAHDDPLPKDGLLTYSLLKQMVRFIRLAGPYGSVTLEIGSDGRVVRVKYQVSEKATYT